MSTYVEPRTGSSSAVKPGGKNLAIQAPRTNTEKAFRVITGLALLNIPLGFYDGTTGRFVAIILGLVLLATLYVHAKESRERRNV